MSAKHTPGPWSVSSLDDTWEAPYRNDGKTSSLSAVVNADGETVALPVVAYDEWLNPEKDAELDANARLIAAAPELLEALKLCQRALQSQWSPYLRAGDKEAAAMKAAGSAIAKATTTTAQCGQKEQL